MPTPGEIGQIRSVQRGHHAEGHARLAPDGRAIVGCLVAGGQRGGVRVRFVSAREVVVQPSPGGETIMPQAHGTQPRRAVAAGIGEHSQGARRQSAQRRGTGKGDVLIGLLQSIFHTQSVRDTE